MRRIQIAVAMAIVAAMALWFVASSQGGDADRLLRVGGGHVAKVSPTERRIAFARDMPWQWNLWAVKRSSPASVDRVCLLVDLQGPMGFYKGGYFSEGPEFGHRGCGPIDPTRGLVVTLPIKGGSEEFPGGTQHWKSFDLGAAAYPPSVDQVRLVFSDGGSAVLKPRAIPGRVAFKNIEPFRYVVFRVRGCVSEVEGLEKGQVVAHVGPRDCSYSP